MSPIVSSTIAVHGNSILRSPISIALIGLLCVVFTSCGSIGQMPTVQAATSSVRTDKGLISISGNPGPATVGKPYNAVLSVTGGSAPYHFSVGTGALPQGLSLGPGTGTISGTPSKSGTFDFTVVVGDRRRHDHGKKRLEIAVSGLSNPSKPGAPVKVGVLPDSGTLASGAKLQFTATVQNTSNTAVFWSASSGTVLSSGLFTAPLVTATKSVTVTATSAADRNARGSATVSVTAPAPTPNPTPSPLTITTSALPAAQTGVSYNASVVAQGGTAPYSWSVSAGSLPQGLTLDSKTGLISGTPSPSGTFTFTVVVADSASHATQTFILAVETQAAGGNYDGPAELPRVYVKSAMTDTPASRETILVNAGGNLQAAVNSANCGDTVELQAGAAFTGAFILPAKSCDDNHWIIIRTSAPDSALPPEGTRITPCYAGVSSLPGRPTFNCGSTANVMPKISMGAISGSGPITFASGANHYRLLGLEITRPLGSQVIFSLAHMQNGGPTDHIVFDRVWMHGTAQDETARGIALGGSTYVAVVDSFFSDFHCISVSGTCTDAQAIMGGLGNLPMGPYKIVNNFLEAAAENILFGGGAASLTPGDIEVRHNHMFKPQSWQRGQPGYVGGTNGNAFIVKNLFELKNAERVLFEGNVLENTWGGFSQVGFGILLSPKSQSNLCPLCTVRDITLRYNKVSRTGAAMQIINALSDAGGAAKEGSHYSIHDLVFDDLKYSPCYGCDGNLFQISGASAFLLNHITLSHITAATDRANSFGLIGGAAGPYDMVFQDSIMGTGAYNLIHGGCSAGLDPLATFNTCWAAPYVFDHNVLAGGTGAWPAGNFFPLNMDAVGFVNFAGGINGDYRLSPASPFKGKAGDGKDPGADIDAVNQATQGAQ